MPLAGIEHDMLQNSSAVEGKLGSVLTNEMVALVNIHNGDGAME